MKKSRWIAFMAAANLFAAAFAPGVPEAVRRAKEAGLRVCLRAGDTEEAVRRMLELGLDYIPTNRMHGPLPR